ncbi:MAG: hypothetical protein PUP92_21300 [Rhizonema sp. PD38]|nr:hypothetical protein [Rhizonema sp. PD38]
MPNGFPEGKFRIINQDTGIRLLSHDNGFVSGSLDAKSSTTHETGEIKANFAQDPSFRIGSSGGKGDDDLWWFHQGKDAHGRLKGNYLMSNLDVTNGRFALQAERPPGNLNENVRFLMARIDEVKKSDFGTPIKNLFLPDVAEKIVKALATLYPQESSDLSFEQQSSLSVTKWVEMNMCDPDEDEIIIEPDVVKLALSERISMAPREQKEMFLTLWGWGREGVSKWQAEGGYIFLEGKPELVLTLVKNGGSHNATLVGKGEPNQRWQFEPKS